MFYYLCVVRLRVGKFFIYLFIMNCCVLCCSVVRNHICSNLCSCRPVFCSVCVIVDVFMYIFVVLNVTCYMW